MSRDNIYMNSQVQNMILEKWKKVIDNPGCEKIRNKHAKVATALVLENVAREYQYRKLIKEAAPEGGIAAASTGAFGTWSPDTYGGNADARVPSIVITLLRRIFPKLISHELVGIQPMSGPVGFVYGLRFEYGYNRQFNSDGDNWAGKELGYNNLDATFAGASSTSTIPSACADYWAAYAGNTGMGLYGGDIELNAAAGASLSTAEWSVIGQNMPTGQFKFVKATVEAKERMLGGMWSEELAEDMLKMHGLNADEEMTNALSYELQASIDRACVSEMVRSALSKGHVSVWSPVSADGRNQIERIGTLWTQLLAKANDIAVTTRLGAGNFVVASPLVCTLLQRAAQTSNYNFVTLDEGKGGIDAAPILTEVGNGSIARVGLLGNQLALYRDTFAGGNYALVGFKGRTPMESGVIYAPYIPIQISRVVYTDFNPRIRVRCRDAIIGETTRPEPFNAGLFYQFIKIDGLNSSVLGANSDGKIFVY